MRRAWIPGWARYGAWAVLSAGVRGDLGHEWRGRICGEPDLPEGKIRRVLIVCHGNVCRSPFAGALLPRRAASLEVRSAGIAAGAGAPAEPAAIRAPWRFGVDLEGHAAASCLAAADLGWADLVLGMQGRHRRAGSRVDGRRSGRRPVCLATSFPIRPTPSPIRGGEATTPSTSRSRASRPPSIASANA